MPVYEDGGSPNAILPAVVPQDLGLNPFTDLEVGSNMVKKGPLAPSHFPLATSSNYVRNWLLTVYFPFSSISHFCYVNVGCVSLC